MPHKHITQKEARAMKHRLWLAETKLSNWCSFDQAGTHLGTEPLTPNTAIRMRVARRLGFGILVVPQREQDRLDYYAVKP